MKMTSLYANDLAVEVKNFYIEKLQLGYDNLESTRLTMTQYEDCFYDGDESYTDFWLILADTQWKLGRLEDLIKEKAIWIIESEEDLKNYSFDQSLYEERKKVLNQLLIQLKTDQPEPKRITKLELYTCPWKINDAFALQLQGEDVIKQGIQNRWLIIIKIGEQVVKTGHTMPFVRFKLTDSNVLPQSLREINELDYFTLVKNPCPIIYKSFLWIDKTRPNRKMLKRLIYLGNYDFAVPLEIPTGIVPMQVQISFDGLEFEIAKRYGWYYKQRNEFS